MTDAVKYVKNKRSDEVKKNIIEEILKEGVIQRFEYTHELAWNVMKDFYWKWEILKLMVLKMQPEKPLIPDLLAKERFGWK